MTELIYEVVNMRIAILSINIGRYIDFWPVFYRSAMKNFLRQYKKEFFVFTDHDEVLYSERSNVHVIHQDDLGWPGNSLMRYHMFCGVEKILAQFDYIFFANANLEFFKPIGDEVIPEGDKNLVFVRRANPYIRKEKTVPYENNPNSTAYVEPGESTLYVRGGFNGGGCSELS